MDCSYHSLFIFTDGRVEAGKGSASIFDGYTYFCDAQLEKKEVDDLTERLKKVMSGLKESYELDCKIEEYCHTTEIQLNHQGQKLRVKYDNDEAPRVELGKIIQELDNMFYERGWEFKAGFQKI